MIQKITSIADSVINRGQTVFARSSTPIQILLLTAIMILGTIAAIMLSWIIVLMVSIIGRLPSLAHLILQEGIHPVTAVLYPFAHPLSPIAKFIQVVWFIMIMYLLFATVTVTHPACNIGKTNQK